MENDNDGALAADVEWEFWQDKKSRSWRLKGIISTSDWQPSAAWAQ